MQCLHVFRRYTYILVSFSFRVFFNGRHNRTENMNIRIFLICLWLPQVAIVERCISDSKDVIHFPVREHHDITELK